MSASQFADEVGVQRSSVSHVLSGRNKPSLDFITKIIETYPDINSDWLISGKGEMWDNKNIDGGERQDSEHEKGEDLFSGEENIPETPVLPPVEAKVPSGKGKTDSRKTATGSKTIDKIVFFYHDGTFSEYAPE